MWISPTEDGNGDDPGAEDVIPIFLSARMGVAVMTAAVLESQFIIEVEASPELWSTGHISQEKC